MCLLFTATSAKRQGLIYIVNYAILYRHRTIVYVDLENIHILVPNVPRLNWHRAINTAIDYDISTACVLV